MGTAVGSSPGRVPRWDGRRWWLALSAVAAVGLLIRVVYIVGWQHPTAYPLDALYYHTGANGLADGHGFVNPLRQALGQVAGVSRREPVYPAVDHPPGFIVVLAATSVLGMTSALAHQVWCAVLGVVTVVLVGLLGRRLAGGRAGIVAAAVAAVYPALWSTDAYLASETVAILLCALAVLLAYLALDRPTPLLAVALGAVVAAGALTRVELLLLVPLLVVPALIVGSGDRWRAARLAAISVAVLVALVLPWTLWASSQLAHPVPISSSSGAVLAGANCSSTYHGAHIGDWNFICSGHGGGGAGLDPTIADRRKRDQAFHAIRENLGRMPIVTLARLGRTYGIFKPISSAEGDFNSERPVAVTLVVSYWLLVVASVPGALLLRRRGVRIWPLLSLVALTFVVTVTSYGNVRFRAPAELTVVVLGAVAVDRLIGRLTSSGARREPEHTPVTGGVPVG